MKTLTEKLKVRIGLIGLIGLITAPNCARAESGSESFHMTNVLNGAVSLVNYPTNGIGTNGVGALTGNAIYVGNQEWAGFYFTGLPNTTCSNANIDITLVRGYGPTKPTVTLDQNGMITNTFWEDPISQTATKLRVSRFSTTDATNAFLFITNLPPLFTAACQWVGVYIATNGSTNTVTLTNVDCGLIKKLYPTGTK